MERELFVYVEMRGESVLAGRLWIRVRQRTESATFLYKAEKCPRTALVRSAHGFPPHLAGVGAH